MSGVEPQEDGAEIEALFRELLEYLRGDRTRLEWALDLRLARSDFHRAVLRATAAVPYGAVTSYAGIAAEMAARQGRRVAILDVDVHHGNGTQILFYDRADILTISVHGDPAYLYPFFAGYADETGAGALYRA